MIIEQRLRVLAKFFARNRFDGDPYLDALFGLDDYWDECYQSGRVRLGFVAAQTLANECVLSLVLSDGYEINTPSPTLETPKNAGGNQGEGVGEQ